MTAFVLDNSVTMRWCFENTVNPHAESVLQRMSMGDGAVVPILWLYEFVSVLAKAERGGIIANAVAEAFLASLQSLNIEIDDRGADRVLTDVHALATTYRLTGYDAVYLELALRRNLPLDTELARACLAAWFSESVLLRPHPDGPHRSGPATGDHSAANRPSRYVEGTPSNADFARLPSQ